MQLRACLFLLAIFLLSGCGLQEQRKQLQQELAAVRQKQQQLALKEQELNAQKKLLDQRQKKMDSILVAKDTLTTLYPNLQGNWTAKMICTETTCPGSALGDTKVEQWAISFDNNQVIVKAMNNRMQLIRIYTGSIDANRQMALVAQSPDVDSQNNTAAKITIQLKISGNKSMDGQREIIQPGNCHIIYSLNLSKG